jgi:serine/threonine-protein kinase HipA
MKSALEVWIDCDLTPLQQIGTLSHDRGTVWFEYEKAWLDNPVAFQIDPELHLGEGPVFFGAESGNFGIFLDSAPDRWGQTLMNRREILLAKDEGRRARKLYPWDFLQGVQDVTRQGALRFKLRGDQEFVAHDDLAAPPVTSLAELSDIATALTRTDIDDLDQLRRWLAALVAPGASLGGARPKANFIDEDDSVWIAKFPAYQDTRDVGGWEYLVWTMAQQAGIDTPTAKKKKIGQSGYHTFCVRRFDRVGKSRRFYASAMTMLRAKETADGSNSYLELAGFLSDYGDPDSIDTDLAQLFRRVVFNVIVGNRDDHLRNHGFLLGRRGWRLAPAFDMNPAIDKEAHVLNLDEVDNRPSLDHVRATASYYRLQSAEADQIIHEVVGVVKNWEELAMRHGLPSLERLEARRAFEAYRVDA